MHDQASQGVALVTGAANGIGRTIALRLARDGFDLALNDLEASRQKLQELQQEVKSLSRRALIVTADVTAEDEVQAMVDTTMQELGGLDVMVANAGIMVWKPINLSNLQDFESTMSVNVRGVFLCYKYAGIAMIASGKRSGRIIGASSFAGKRGSKHCGVYCASKFAVRGLTQSYAAELGPHGITVNAYAPGPVETDMLRRMDSAHHEIHGVPIGSYTENAKHINPLGRNGKAEDVAGLVSYLASPGARFVTVPQTSTDAVPSLPNLNVAIIMMLHIAQVNLFQWTEVPSLTDVDDGHDGGIFEIFHPRRLTTVLGLGTPV